jgi:hypothetical protein
MSKEKVKKWHGDGLGANENGHARYGQILIELSGTNELFNLETRRGDADNVSFHHTTEKSRTEKRSEKTRWCGDNREPTLVGSPAMGRRLRQKRWVGRWKTYSELVFSQSSVY